MRSFGLFSSICLTLVLYNEYCEGGQPRIGQPKATTIASAQEIKFYCDNNSELTLDQDSLTITFPHTVTYKDFSGKDKTTTARTLCFFSDPQKFSSSRWTSAKDLIFLDSGDFVNCDYTGVIILNLKNNKYALLKPNTFELVTHQCERRQ